MNHTEDTGLKKLAVQIVTTYERMKRNAAYRALSLIFGCITLIIVKLVQMASKEKNAARTRREQLYKELVDQMCIRDRYSTKPPSLILFIFC